MKAPELLIEWFSPEVWPINLNELFKFGETDLGIEISEILYGLWSNCDPALDLLYVDEIYDFSICLL